MNDHRRRPLSCDADGAVEEPCLVHRVHRGFQFMASDWVTGSVTLEGLHPPDDPEELAEPVIDGLLAAAHAGADIVRVLAISLGVIPSILEGGHGGPDTRTVSARRNALAATARRSHPTNRATSGEAGSDDDG